MKIRITPSQIQKTILAPSMQQSIEVLLLPIDELNTSIDQELENNPLLEVADDIEDANQRELEEYIKKQLEHMENDHTLPYMGHYSDDDILEEAPIKMVESLEDLLLTQLHIELSDPIDIKIGEHIIGNLNEDGYLTCTVEDIMEISKIDDPNRIEKVLDIIQQFEPIGIASRDLKECLLAQVDFKCNGHSELVRAILTDHLEYLGKKKFKEIAKALKITVDQVKETSKLISTFEPKPARKYRACESNIYVKPDIFVTKKEDQFVIDVNTSGLPTLRISNFYKKMLTKPNIGFREREFIQEKLKNAIQFIKSIEQRNTTIRKISEYIIDRQKEFFEYGHTALLPMTLKDVAEAVSRNESTISRAINNKYINTPQGLYSMKFFFSQEVGNNDNTSASRSVKEEIKYLICSEDQSAPLSDQHLQNILTKRGMPVARRTVSKYRQAMRILPSHLRKN